MMRLLPENNQTVLYELVNKITYERNRSKEDGSKRVITQVDPLLNEKAFQEKVKQHKIDMEFLNQEGTID
jgi:hypothetical protein